MSTVMHGVQLSSISFVYIYSAGIDVLAHRATIIRITAGIQGARVPKDRGWEEMPTVRFNLLAMDKERTGE